MKTEEDSYLYHEKVDCEHKSIEQAKNEINRFRQSQIKFKQLERDCNKKDTIIKNLNNQIEKLRKLNFKKLIPQTKIKEINNKKIDNESLIGLDRMLCILNEEKKIGLTDLERTARVKPEICKRIINILIRNNIIREVKEPNNRFNTLYIERI